MVLTVDYCRVFIWILTLTGMILICIYGVEESTTLINELDLVFRGNQGGNQAMADPNLSCL